MVRGNFPTRADEKGRLKVPAELKRSLEERYSTEYYITSLDGKEANVYPMEEWERIEKKIAELPSFNPTRKKFLDRTNYYGQEAEMDGQGRVLLPALLRESANLKGELSVVWQLNHLQVKNMEDYRAQMAQEEWNAQDTATLSELGI